MKYEIYSAKKTINTHTAWRIEGTLREFPKFEPVNLWFTYPVHELDKVGSLKDISTEPPVWNKTWKQNFQKKKSPEDVKKERKEALETHFSSCQSFNENGNVTIQDLAEAMGVTEKTVRNRIKEHGGFWIDEGNVGRKN